MNLDAFFECRDHLIANRPVLAASVLGDTCRSVPEVREALEMLGGLPNVAAAQLERLEQRLIARMGGLPPQSRGLADRGIRLAAPWDGLESLGFLTPLRNLPSILSLGILSHRYASRVDHESVADDDIQRRRSVTPVRGRSLHDYANLYVNPRNAMLYRVTHEEGHDNIAVVHVSPRHALSLPGVMVSDRNAAAADVQFFLGTRGLAQLVWNDVFAPSWTNTKAVRNAKQRMMAEVLVPDRVPPRMITHVSVHNETAIRNLERLPGHVQLNCDPSLFF